MASFFLDKTKLSLLAAALTAGLDSATNASALTAPNTWSEDSQAIAALLEELDAIACANGSAEITVMGMDAEETAFVAATLGTGVADTAELKRENRPSTRDIPRAPVIDDEPQPAWTRT